MNLEKKLLIDKFIDDNKDDETFNLVLEKLNDFLSSFLNEIIEKTNYSVNFKLNLIGDYYLSSNFINNNFIHIMIDYITNEEDLKFSEKRSKKGAISKLTTDAFNMKKNVVPTNNQLIKLLYDEFTLKLQNSKIYMRKKCLGLNLMGYKFFIFFVNSNQIQNEYNFIIKSKNYNFDFNLLHENLLKKNKETHGNFFKLVKFFKVVELELMILNKLTYKASNTLYFYENLLYNVPNDLLNNDLVFDNFIVSLSYLQNIDLNELKTADNIPLINDFYQIKTKPAITSLDVTKVFKQCKVFIDNVDKILSPNE